MSDLSPHEEQTKIYWREETESYFPRIDDEEIAGLLMAELKRHQAEIESGQLVSAQQKIEQNQQGSRAFIRNHGKENRETDYDSLSVTNDFLQELLGTWIPDQFVWAQLRYYLPDMQVIISIPEEELGTVVGILVSRLKELRDEYDDFFKKVDPALEQANGIAESDQVQSFSSALQELVIETAEETGCVDRWFDVLCSQLELYAYSKNSTLKYDDVDLIAGGYFESWCPPEEDQIVKFGDELAATFVKKIGGE